MAFGGPGITAMAVERWEGTNKTATIVISGLLWELGKLKQFIATIAGRFPGMIRTRDAWGTYHITTDGDAGKTSNDVLSHCRWVILGKLTK